MRKYFNELNALKLVVKSGRAIHVISKEDIKWIKAEGNYATLILNQSKRLVSRISLEEMLQKLPPEKFVRIHKSYLINLTHVSQLSANFVFISEDKLPIGRVYQRELHALFAVQIL